MSEEKLRQIVIHGGSDPITEDEAAEILNELEALRSLFSAVQQYQWEEISYGRLMSVFERVKKGVERVAK